MFSVYISERKTKKLSPNNFLLRSTWKQIESPLKAALWQLM